MHSRIFQVSEQPIESSDYYDSSQYYDGFVNEIADWVDDVCEEDIKGCYEWLGSTPGLKYNSNKHTITVTNKREFFESRYKKFKESIDKLAGITLDEFISSKNVADVLDANYYYNDKFEFYFDSDSYGLLTISSFIREVREGQEFYLGAVIDYHF